MRARPFPWPNSGFSTTSDLKGETWTLRVTAAAMCAVWRTIQPIQTTYIWHQRTRNIGQDESNYLNSYRIGATLFDGVIMQQ